MLTILPFRIVAICLASVAVCRATLIAQVAKQPLNPNTQSLVSPRGVDGNGDIEISGQLKRWHKITLTLDGPFAHERDESPNPFRDIRFVVTFTHESGQPTYRVPGYFTADGSAAETSAESGTRWRAHLSPDKTGQWQYRISMSQAAEAALNGDLQAELLLDYDGKSGVFDVAESDKSGRDLRGKGRLEYVGKHYLRFAGTSDYFIKAGADAPETLLGFADFDNTMSMNPAKVPLKTFAAHVRDWRPGNPTWKSGRGKGLIGAINYLSGKGCNAFSFLSYNAGGDGDNVWPFVERDDKLHYDCSKLDQWQIVFDHGTAMGMYLHFKMQETENDDNRIVNTDGRVPASLDGGELGTERMLYCRELVARFSHELALNWNLGEENTQTTAQQQAMINYIFDLDPYDHNIVVHTFPNKQALVYEPLLGGKSRLSGVSLQNSNIRNTHRDTLRWVRESSAAGKPWIVAFDESGSAEHGQCPDIGYKGFDGRDADGKMIYTEHEVRKQTLWGTLMAGGAGVEYYFGYKFVENDLVCEDWRSRDRSWDYCRVAINFFHDNKIPFWEMTPTDELVGTSVGQNDRYCFAKKNEIYLVYLAESSGDTRIDLTHATGAYKVRWFNPRQGGPLREGSIATIQAGTRVSIGMPPEDITQDWLAVVRR